jgi:ABC-2 type transport system permease protein
MILIGTRLYRAWRARQAPAVSEGESLSELGGEMAGSDGLIHSSAASRGPLALLFHQVRYDLLGSFRNPRARFFTFVFPILVLVIFAGVFGHGSTTVDGVRVKLSHYYVPGILAMSIITAAYGNLVVSISSARESGVLKRRRATPVPPALLVAGQALSTLAVTVIMSAILLVLARVGYGVALPVGALAAIACAAVVGTLTFACLGYAISGLIGSPDAAQPMVQMTTMPLYFISGVWIPSQQLGGTLRSIASVFPVEHLAAAMHLASVRGSFSSAVSLTDLLVLGAWALVAAVFAAWRFSWLPSTATV